MKNEAKYKFKLKQAEYVQLMYINFIPYHSAQFSRFVFLGFIFWWKLFLFFFGNILYISISTVI